MSMCKTSSLHDAKAMQRIFAAAMLAAGQPLAWAADAAVVSPAASLFKMLLGLGLVLAVMALIAWGMKRLAPGKAGLQSVANIVGGVSLGSRERIVVIEVADRWLVVGVAPGQISAIANLDKSTAQLAEVNVPKQDRLSSAFAGWLKKALDKDAKETPDAK